MTSHTVHVNCDCKCNTNAAIAAIFPYLQYNLLRDGIALPQTLK